jgi:trehalose 6-phosphate phosphatase
MMDIETAMDHLLDAQPLALTTDFDGTLSEIAPSPELATIHPRCRDSLAKLSEKLTLVAVLSGRQVDELRQLVGLPGVVYIGNHGLERWERSERFVEPSVSQYVPLMHDVLKQAQQELKLPGLLFEEKGVSASIHYRLAVNPSAAREHVASLLRKLAADAGLRVVEGRRVVELRPPLDLDKGTALLDLLRGYALGGVVYAGDDRTDLDAFAAIHRWGLEEGKRALVVGVISAEMPPGLTEEADLTVEGVEGWADLLAALAEAVSMPTDG